MPWRHILKYILFALELLAIGVATYFIGMAAGAFAIDIHRVFTGRSFTQWSVIIAVMVGITYVLPSMLVAAASLFVQHKWLDGILRPLWLHLTPLVMVMPVGFVQLLMTGLPK